MRNAYDSVTRSTMTAMHVHDAGFAERTASCDRDIPGYDPAFHALPDSRCARN